MVWNAEQSKAYSEMSYKANPHAFALDTAWLVLPVYGEDGQRFEGSLDVHDTLFTGSN